MWYTSLGKRLLAFYAHLKLLLAVISIKVMGRPMQLLGRMSFPLDN
jgi:hypothetical protein